MNPRTISNAAQPPRELVSPPKVEMRSPLAQLLHALNQPLTGLQCSMEVALAGPRTPEQYVHGLREGLVLTERMRALVEAIRELVDQDEEKDEGPGTADLAMLLREAQEGLQPVAETKSVCCTLNGPAPCLATVRTGPRRLEAILFRLLESSLSLAARGSALRIETGGAPAEVWVRLRWHGGRPPSAFSRPELGLLVAQAGLERAGGVWERERTDSLVTVTVRLPGVSRSGKS